MVEGAVAEVGAAGGAGSTADQVAEVPMAARTAAVAGAKGRRSFSVRWSSGILMDAVAFLCYAPRHGPPGLS